MFTLPLFVNERHMVGYREKKPGKAYFGFLNIVPIV